MSLVLLLALSACGSPLARAVALTHEPPLVPTQLSVTTADGRAVPAGGWTNRPELHLSAALRSPDSGAKLAPEVEILPVDQPFSGQPNLIGTAGQPAIAVPRDLLTSGQRYHWQIRAREVAGKAGPWVPWEGSVGYDAMQPPSPSIDPLPNDGWVNAKSVVVHWAAVAGKSGIAGFAFSLDQSASGEPPAKPNLQGSSATINPSRDGDWFFHLRTLSKAGSWSPTATLPLHRDTARLKIADVLYRSFAYNPDYGTLHIAFSLSKPADTTVTILPNKAGTVLRTFSFQGSDKVDIQWDGKDDKGGVVPAGNYRFRVVARDRAGNSVDAIYDKLLISDKRIVVSLSQQKMWAYDGDKVFLDTLVTTGNPLLPTPTGTFQILSKQPNFTFHSPWPKGNPFWYPDSFTNFAMMFDTGGYFIHDAPWRHKFGPGSNLVPGQPGEDTSGTHGCVNVPEGTQSKLFSWTDPGTPVVIQS
ncbi:MAG: L,D-transpeptidase family protein [Chloroflexota bacterium]|nr:L,D-transpeptidase family protein [Chloroflexota bacterium]